MEARIGLALGLGAATFFAPCAFPLLPGYVAYYLGRGGERRDGGTPTGTGSEPLPTRLRDAAVVGVLTSLGFFLVYAALAGVALSLGTRVLANVSVLELVVGVLLVGLGSAMAAGWTPSSLHLRLPERRRTPAGFVLFGVVYAAAAAGCTAPLFVGLAGVALSAGPVGAVVTLGAYALGMSLLMVGVTLLSALGRDAVLRRLAANTGRITRVAGAVLVLAGIVQLYYFLFVFGGLRTLGL
jgi:cytochrome c-type biogenesis protein